MSSDDTQGRTGPADVRRRDGSADLTEVFSKRVPRAVLDTPFERLCTDAAEILDHPGQCWSSAESDLAQGDSAVTGLLCGSLAGSDPAP
jgi:hypothetical protein